MTDAVRSSAESAQPVAYRFNTHGDQRWRVVIDKPVPKAGVTAFDKIEALYLQPTRTEPQTAPSDIERAFQDACDEAGCAYDNEALLEAIHALKERSQAESAK